MAANFPFFLATALALTLSMAVGGGQGWLGERLLELPALALALLAIWRLESMVPKPAWRRYFYALPCLLLVLPLLQLLPLPWSLWSRLPGREAIADSMLAAGQAPHWLHWSVAPWETLRAALALLVPGGLFMACLMLGGAQRRRLLALVLAIAALNILLGLVQLLEGPASRFYFYAITNNGDAVGLFANRNHLASLLATALPVATGMLVDRLRHRRHAARDLRVWLLTALLVLLAVGVTATRSRAALLLLMCSLAGSCLVLLRSRGHRAAWVESLRWLQLGAVLALVLIVQYTLFALLSRLQADPLDDLRWRLTAQTLQVAAPFRGTGLGIGSFVQAYDLIGDASASLREYINHAHNDYAELWLEGGVPALLLMLLAVYACGTQLRRQWRLQSVNAALQPAERDHHRSLMLGVAFSLALLALHSAIDYPLRTLAMQAYAALLAAMLVAAPRPGEARSSGRPEARSS